ncbi:hypothetical protein LY474_27550 [Myxococcus stipitatus]|uniref:hypothetical protein n=1 Tax=Myxococcus stipitatus TaxID=83455 RepID=UPI001F1DE093|nr:hypothetical protein [Myxococcus stipitatus]MCE9671568.1 hypothetical protein [Myxococcus stipitatus]
MKVRGHDGHAIGRIVDMNRDELIVEKRLLRRHDYLVSLEDVREVRRGEVILNHGRDSLFFAPREVTPIRH